MTYQERKKIEDEFFNYKANRDKAANYVASSAFDGFAIDYSHERVKSSGGNSVERALINAISEEERLWKWCLVFEKTLDKYRWEQKDKLIIKKYIEKKNATKICFEIGIERRTYFYWLEEILQTAFMWAQMLKLF